MTQGLPGGMAMRMSPAAAQQALAGQSAQQMPAQQAAPMAQFGMPQQGGMGPIAGRVGSIPQGGFQPTAFPSVQRLGAMAGPPQLSGMFQPPQAGAAARAFPMMMPTYQAPAPMPQMGLINRFSGGGGPGATPGGPASFTQAAQAPIYQPTSHTYVPPVNPGSPATQAALPTLAQINPAQLYNPGPMPPAPMGPSFANAPIGAASQPAPMGMMGARGAGPMLSDRRMKRVVSLREILGR